MDIGTTTKLDYDGMRTKIRENTREYKAIIDKLNYIERFWVAENIKYFNKCNPKTVNDSHYQDHARKKNWLPGDLHGAP